MNEPPDPNSRLHRVYNYLRVNPDSHSLPDDCMPPDYQVYYVFQHVKNLRDNTGYPELTYEELEKMMHEELTGWRDDKKELPDWFLEKHGLNKPIMKRNDDG